MRAVESVRARTAFWSGLYLLLIAVLSWMTYVHHGRWWGWAVELGGVAVFALANVVSHTVVWMEPKVRNLVNPFTDEVDP